MKTEQLFIFRLLKNNPHTTFFKFRIHPKHEDPDPCAGLYQWLALMTESRQYLHTNSSLVGKKHSIHIGCFFLKGTVHQFRCCSFGQGLLLS